MPYTSSLYHPELLSATAEGGENEDSSVCFYDGETIFPLVAKAYHDWVSTMYVLVFGWRLESWGGREQHAQRLEWQVNVPEGGIACADKHVDFRLFFFGHQGSSTVLDFLLVTGRQSDTPEQNIGFKCLINFCIMYHAFKTQFIAQGVVPLYIPS